MTLEEMNDEFVVARTNKKEFLNKMDSIIPWDTFVKEIEPYYYKGERDNKPYPLELMLRTVKQRQAMTTQEMLKLSPTRTAGSAGISMTA